MTINITHGIYDKDYNRFIYRDDSLPIIIPTKFIQLLLKKSKKWNKRKHCSVFPLIPFTIGHDMTDNIWAIAIVHPFDILKSSLKIAEDIVKGRIKRELGDIIGRLSYSERTILSKQCAYNANDDKLIIPFPDYIISPMYLEEQL